MKSHPDIRGKDLHRQGKKMESPSIFKADLHIHTYRSPDSLAKPIDIIRAAEKKGLSAIAITDHDEISGALEVARLAKENGSCLQVIIGEEVLCDEGDLLVYFLKKRIPPCPLEKALAEAARQGAVCSIAHPYDFARHAINPEKIPAKLLLKIRAVEVLNSRAPIESMNKKAHSFADSNKKVKLAGSDAHHHSEIGTAYVEFFGIKKLDAKSLLFARREIKGKRSSPIVRLHSRYAKLVKRITRKN